MRSIFIIPTAFALALITVFAASPAFAQTSGDDLYGVPGGGAAAPDTAAPPDTVAAPAIPASPDTGRPAAPRARVIRETTINPLDAQRGAYRNPKKALFMSLMVPGLGQAYVGQSAFNYARAAAYFGTEIALGVLWYQFTVVKYDREVKRYRRFADAHWSLGQYEDSVFQISLVIPSSEAFDRVTAFRGSYCDALTGRGTAASDTVFAWCSDPLGHAGYSNFKSDYDDRSFFSPNTPDPDTVGFIRSRFSDPVSFYSLIGQYQEFIFGWDDALNAGYDAADTSIAGSSANRDAYNSMRQKAQDYSRMQAWFIGGLVLNHIASAVDAALTARHNNRVLYEGEARWFDRLNLDGGLAFEAGRPRTHMTARLSF